MALNPLKVVRNLRPTYRLRDISAITPDFLDRSGIEGVIWDVDGTVMSYHADRPADELARNLEHLFSHGSASHVILSNCDEERYAALGSIFPEIPVLRAYRTEHGIIPRRLLRGEDSLTAGEVRDLLASGGMMIRKPNADLVRLALEELEVDDPARALMVGDQYLTDVASANMAGIRSAKVNAWDRDSFPLPIRMSQRLVEPLVYFLRHGPPDQYHDQRNRTENER